ncbi:SDR family oxidoreductase [Candidatus Chloroploca asiatica]|nr:SDR family oxidoreductase [Candidatus Chloroploca asiatica]
MQIKPCCNGVTLYYSGTITVTNMGFQVSPSSDIYSEFDHWVVTGASGLLGANFLRVAAHPKRLLTGIFNKHPLALPGTRTIHADLLCSRQIIDSLDDLKPNVIFHFAAATNVDWCQAHQDEATKMNVDVTHNLVNWAELNGCLFVLMSTDSIFDGVTGAYIETSTPHPCNHYAATKWQAEQIVIDALDEYLVVRANIFGWNAQNKLSLAEWILTKLETKQEIPGFIDTTFAPLLVNTLSGLLIRMVEQGCRGVFHAASTTPISKHEFALETARTFNLSERLVLTAKLEDSELLAPRPLHTWLCADKLAHHLKIDLPTIRQELTQFKRLRDTGYTTTLKYAYKGSVVT